ncbi:Beta-ureidopropionase [Eumeta japonica]|uniref:Beta-ureidopropionase n=1 Tax=Eumeta variegata TaxID=151549 RepID=A0A4C1SWT2_EUMVA|nr:Beta-ureidopropionase [Eumeta japonica]
MATKERSLENAIKTKLNEREAKEFNRIYYGREEHCELELKESTLTTCDKENIDVQAYKFYGATEEARKPRLTKIGLVQHSIVLPTDKPIKDQQEAIFQKVKNIIDIAASEGVQLLCLQETWSMPFFLCTQQKSPWISFTESAESGPSVMFLRKLAAKYDMVIISPILEIEEGVWWNTVVVIGESGNIIGKHRKNHLPSAPGSSCETPFYSPGNTGHPVFETKYGRIAINICYGRHHALNWLMFRLNNAEIVFNPCATLANFGEPFWHAEARNAAIANGYFTCCLNRVGKEHFIINTEDGDNVVDRSYFGSGYISAPDGTRTPSLSTVRDGLLITVVDLNLCRQTRDRWGFIMTSRLDDYAKELKEYVK